MLMDANRHWVVTCTALVSFWAVRVYYLPDERGRFCSLPVVLQSTDNSLPNTSVPVSLAISPDGILACVLNRGGTHLYALASPLGELGPRVIAIKRLEETEESRCITGQWTGMSGELNCFTTQSQKDGSNAVVVSSYADLKVQTPDRSTIFCHTTDHVGFFGASPPGNVAALERTGLLHLLKLDPSRSHYSIKTVTTLKDRLLATGMAVGTDFVVVGYSTGTGGGVVVFGMDDATLMIHRSLPNLTPTALSTSGTRILVGASSDNGNQSALYAMSTKLKSTFIVCEGDPAAPLWPAGSVCMSEESWCYLRTLQIEGRLSVRVEHVVGLSLACN